MVQQVEIMGQPFSQGSAGQGVRLLIGSDLAPYEALVPTDVSDANNQTLTPASFPTRWLLPASLAEFDPRCNSSDVGAAQAANCSLIGTFHSCERGCGLDPPQEALWDALPGVLLGMRKDTWTIADGAVWREIRGMLAGFSYFNNQTGPADTFLMMEGSLSTSYAEPFTGLSDRAFWVVNQSANVRMQDLAFALDGRPVFRSFALNTKNVYYHGTCMCYCFDR